MNNLNPAEAAHMNKIIEKKQMQDFMKLYSGLVERCFNTCITDFTSKALTGREVSSNPRRTTFVAVSERS